MIHVENISYHYRGYPNVLQDICFHVNDGETLAILGNNGVGKSTLLKCSNHILRANSGTVMLDGADILSMPIREAAKQVVFVSQNVPNIEMTVYDIVMLGRKPYMRWYYTKNDHAIIHEVMERLNLTGDMQGRFLNQLSGGERQKVILARALAQRPKVLLLDEPISNLDIRNQYQVLQIIQDICYDDGISAIMVIYDLNLALRFCDRFLLMQQGQVYKYGDMSILDTIVLKEVYDVDARIVKVEGHYTVLVET
ncbi:ABC transporter ATP-binding protein [Treponema phagedenis]|uniref:ABC transporter ATP-binding protein n=1 Tax=Treponema phagedenis TaxID=162 RepID=UPI000309DF01|nr:ABC transporter ATP-binding protein [Treponema phagedenis]TYT78823.1 ABC transporter ATP-binding protein [Treponema phagedenis]